jgi:hypothetical protein
VYWRDDEGERQLLARTSDELTRFGLLNGRNLTPEFRETMELITRASVEFYGWIATQESNIAVLVAAIGEEAVVLVRDGKEVTFQPARSDGLADTLLGYLPQVQAARGRSINLRETDVRELVGRRGAGGPGEAKPLSSDAYSIFDRPTEAEDARELFSVMELPRTGGGELYAAARGRTGERRRFENPLIYTDTQQGRWMTQMTGDRPGDRWLVFAPASRQLMLAKLNEMRDRLYN